MKKPTESSEAISAKQTSSVKQLNPATCTKPSIVQQQSYSTMTSSQTSTDKTACTTTKQPPSKQAIATSTNPNFDRMDVKQIKAFISLQVFKSPLTANLNLFSCLKQFIDLFMDLPTVYWWMFVKMSHTSSWTKTFVPLPDGVISQWLLPAPSIWTSGHFWLSNYEKTWLW